MLKPVRVPEIPEAEQTPLVRGLVGIIGEQAEQLRQQEEVILQLKEEIAVLKGEKKRPRFKASGMEEKAGQDEEERRLRNGRGRRSGPRPSYLRSMKRGRLRLKLSQRARDLKGMRTT
jgi:hypothetical protein